MRKLLFSLCLSAACLAGMLSLERIRVPALEAQQPPACGNSQCSGPSYCIYGNANSCQFLSPNACETRRCAFITQY